MASAILRFFLLPPAPPAGAPSHATTIPPERGERKCSCEIPAEGQRPRAVQTGAAKPRRIVPPCRPVARAQLPSGDVDPPGRSEPGGFTSTRHNSVRVSARPLDGQGLPAFTSTPPLSASRTDSLSPSYHRARKGPHHPGRPRRSSPGTLRRSPRRTSLEGQPQVEDLLGVVAHHRYHRFFEGAPSLRV